MMRSVISIAFTAALCVLTSGAWGFDLVKGVSVGEMNAKFVYIYNKTLKVDGTVERPKDFAWKDPFSAWLAGQDMPEYLTSCLKPEFRHRLYSLIIAAEQAGFEVGLTALCRNYIRQLVAEGPMVASPGSSNHERGLAADLVVIALPRKLQIDKNIEFYLWIEQHPEFGLGLPYGRKDGGHVGMREGEYQAKYRFARSWTKYFADRESGKLVKVAKIKSKDKKKHIQVAKHRKHNGVKKHRA